MLLISQRLRQAFRVFSVFEFKGGLAAIVRFKSIQRAFTRIPSWLILRFSDCGCLSHRRFIVSSSNLDRSEAKLSGKAASLCSRRSFVADKSEILSADLPTLLA